MKRLAGYFLRGLVFLAPIALTVYVFVAAFLKIDSWLRLSIPGIGFGIVIVGITVVGFLMSNFLTRGILSAFDGILDRLPFVKLLHTSVKDLMSAFVGEKRKFDKPCLVQPVAGLDLRVLGFLTRESAEVFAFADHVAVYVPQAYNIGGQLIILPRDRVQPLALDSAHVMTFIVSGGVTGLGK